MDLKPTQELKREIKMLIIDALKLQEVTPEDIDEGANLFEENNPFHIDSVDALEIVMALQKKYHVHIDDQNLGRFIIKSVDTIAEFIAKQQDAKKAEKPGV